ncbi:hypothetical protein ACFL4G_05570 [Thermodesulfobacteriota bacterium]
MIGKMRGVLILLSALSVALVPLTAAWASGGGGHGGDVHVPVGSMIMGFINLGLLICLFVFAYKKIGKEAVVKRSQAVEDKINEAKEAIDSAERKLAEYDDKLTNLDKEIEEIKAHGRADAQRESDEIIRKADEAAQRIKDQARRIATQELESAKEALYKEATNLSVELAGDLLKKEMSSEDRKRLIEEYIQQLGETN